MEGLAWCGCKRSKFRLRTTLQSNVPHSSLGGSPGRMFDSIKSHWNIIQYQEGYIPCLTRGQTQMKSIKSHCHTLTWSPSERDPDNQLLSGPMHLQIQYNPQSFLLIFSTLSFLCRWPMAPLITHHCSTYQTMQKTLVADGLSLWTKVQIGL